MEACLCWSGGVKCCSEVLFVRYLNIGTAAGTQPSHHHTPTQPQQAFISRLSVSVYSAGGHTEVFPRSQSKEETMSGIYLGLRVRVKNYYFGSYAEACFYIKC